MITEITDENIHEYEALLLHELVESFLDEDYEIFVRNGTIKNEKNLKLGTFIRNALWELVFSSFIQSLKESRTMDEIFQTDSKKYLNFLFTAGEKKGNLIEKVWDKQNSDLKQQIMQTYDGFDWSYGISWNLIHEKFQFQGKELYNMILTVQIVDLQDGRLLGFALTDKVPIIDGKLFPVYEGIKLLAKLFQNNKQNYKRNYCLQNAEAHFPEDIPFLILAIRSKKLNNEIDEKSRSLSSNYSIPEILLYSINKIDFKSKGRLRNMFARKSNMINKFVCNFNFEIPATGGDYVFSLRAHQNPNKAPHFDFETSVNNENIISIKHYSILWEDIITSGLYSTFKSRYIHSPVFSKIRLEDHDYLIDKKGEWLSYYIWKFKKYARHRNSKKYQRVVELGDFGFPYPREFWELRQKLLLYNDSFEDKIEEYNEKIHYLLQNSNNKKKKKIYLILDRHMREIQKEIIELGRTKVHLSKIIEAILGKYGETFSRLEHLKE